MSNPFPSNSSLASITDQIAEAGKSALRRMSIKNIISCLFSTSTTETPSSTPGNNSATSTPARTFPASPKSSVSTLDDIPSPAPKASRVKKVYSARSRQQRLEAELRQLRESHFGLQLTLVLPEELHAGGARSAPPENTRPLITACAELVSDDAIPFLDLDAAEEEGLSLSDGAEKTADEVLSEGAVRLQGSEWSRAGSALAGGARTYGAPRDFLFG